MVTDGPKKSTSRHWVPTIKSLSSLYVMGNDPKSKQGHKIDRQVLKGDILKPQIRALLFKTTGFTKTAGVLH